MIDREARDKAATLLRQLVEIEMTHEAFAAGWPPFGSDFALVAIFDMAWLASEDGANRIEWGLPVWRGERPLYLLQFWRELFARSELFLTTDLEYGYPFVRTPDLTDSRPPWWKVLFRYQRSGDRYREYLERIADAGDISVWPFLSRADYEAAKAALSPSR